MSNVMEEIIVNAPGAADPCPTPSGGPGLDECSSTTNDQGSAEAVMRAIDALLEAGRTAEAEKKEALELGLSPARCLRTRQKSSDMEKQCGCKLRTPLPTKSCWLPSHCCQVDSPTMSPLAVLGAWS